MTRDCVEGEWQLHDDQLGVLDYIELYQRTHANRSPSQRHLSLALSIGAASVLQGLLHRLVQANLLRISTRGPGLPVELALTEAGRTRLRQWRRNRAAADMPADDAP